MAIDGKWTGERWEVYINGGRVPTGLDVVGWAREAERLGAGEILLTSMDADGTQAGYDIRMLAAVARGRVDPGDRLGRRGHDRSTSTMR